MTKKIEKNAIDRTMEHIFYEDNLLIRIIAAQKHLAESRG